ncbi:MAG: TetR/AcrR family transcriptional regulator [Oscillospiraceae bacterium]|nr:TetR/AcrR family transcriptional regulator [Oscillospiraceae bacterium]
MYKQCKTEQSAQRQRQLELGLMQMMLTKRYEEISVSDLCDEMNVPRKSFYRYFSSKDGCLFALLDHTMMEFFDSGLGALGLTPGTAIGDLDRYFVFWKEHRLLLDALQRNSLSGILVERAMSLAQRERLMPGYIRNWAQDLQQLALSFAVSGLLSMVVQWHKQNFSTPASEMTRIAVAMLTKPLIQ